MRTLDNPLCLASVRSDRRLRAFVDRSSMGKCVHTAPLELKAEPNPVDLDLNIASLTVSDMR